MTFQVRKGDGDLKLRLQSLLHESGDDGSGLGQFLLDVEETESTNGNWWVVVDSSDQLRSALTVGFSNEFSFLRLFWMGNFQLEETGSTLKPLLIEWLASSRTQANIFRVDLPIFSPLISSLMDSGFSKERILITSYNVQTEWYTEELPEGYVMRAVNIAELPIIYDTIIKPDLDKTSYIFISKSEFVNLGTQLPDIANNSWVAVEDDKNILVGFAASFLTVEKEEPRAILYGPHSKEPKVLRNLIAETLTFWKSKGISRLRIIRVNEYHPSIENYFNMKLSHETIRYSVNTDL
ncbi:MAG: hypothetical protein HeimC2_03770 [Candidatus Heimdallarchaeota archaeon LC_2]|nr:MAG: hypothetical protein HeimC2_03770 [Candidatus Heimdallarchaeota archaeon LC_2]